MAEITNINIERLKASITLDGRRTIAVRKSDLAKLNLSVGDEADFDELTGRLGKMQLDEGYEAALSMLDRSARTKSEIIKKLISKGYLEQVAEAVAERLEGARLIDDKYIADKLVSSAAHSGKGRYSVKQKLRARGVSEEDAEAALGAITDEQQAESCLEAARKLARKYENADSRVFKMKLSQALARRGFSWDSIESALERLISSQ